MTDKLPPHNVEAERAVLGALLIDPDALFKVNTFLGVGDFYVERHNWIYSAVLALSEQQVAVDFVTLCDELERREQLVELGGAAYLTGLANATPTALNIEHYAHIVERLSTLRKLIGAAGEIARVAYADEDGAVDQAEQILFRVTQRQRADDPLTIRQVGDEHYDHVDRAAKTEGILGISTGFGHIDKILNGLQGTRAYLVAGRPSMGKTGLLLSMALHAAEKCNARVAVFSLEMSATQVYNRWVAMLTGIDSSRIFAGKLRDEEWAQYIQAHGKLVELPIWVDDSKSLTVTGLRSKARKLYAQNGLDLLILDYLQLMDSGADARRYGSRNVEVTIQSRGIKLLAGELNIPVLVASQLSRAVEARRDKRPILSDLRDSGSIEQDFDVAIFLYRDEYYNPYTEQPHICEVNIAKWRDGPTGMVPLYFKKETSTFYEVELFRKDLNGYTPPVEGAREDLIL